MELVDRCPSVPISFADKGFKYPWFALRTRSNFESLAKTALAHKGYEPYLPTYRSRRKWSDRVVVSDAPLFKGYVFCRFNPKDRMPVLSAHGVTGVVSYGQEPAAIDEEEILAVQTVLQSGLATEPCPFLREGQRVRILHGSLTGLEGILMKKKADFRLVLSVSMLQRAVSVEIDSDWIMGI